MNKIMWWRCALAAGTVAFLLGSPAAAADTDAVCLDALKPPISADPAAMRQRIAVCTRLLDTTTDPALRTQVLMARAEAYYLVKRPIRALVDLDTAETLSPGQNALLNGRAFVHANMGYFTLALPEVETAIADGAHSAQAYVVRGSSKAFQGHYGEAITDADFAIAENPTLASAYAMRGFANLAIGEMERAIADLSEAIRLQPKDAESFVHRGQAHMGLDQYAEALSDFAAAHAFDPDNVGAEQAMAQIHALMANPAQAAADPNAAPPADAPSTPFGRTHTCGGYYPYLSNRLSEAGSAIIHYDVTAAGTVAGVGLEQSSGFERLDRAAVICVSKHWRNTPAYENGVAVASLRHRARIQFVSYPYPPADPLRAEALVGLGRYDEAVAEFSRIIAIDSGNSDLYLRRGFVHYVQQDYADASQDFAKAQSLKPGSDEAAAALELVRRAVLAAQPRRDGI